MSKRKPLPYAASALLDRALMCLSMAVHSLTPLIGGQALSVEERYRLIAQAIHQVHEGIEAIKEVRRLEG